VLGVAPTDGVSVDLDAIDAHRLALTVSVVDNGRAIQHRDDHASVTAVHHAGQRNGQLATGPA
jgi:hypothetical protein